VSEQSASLAALVRDAANGDQAAWSGLVERFSPLVWSVVRGFQLTGEESADAYQQTWLVLVQHLDRIRDPAMVGGWLAATARREALMILRRRARTGQDDVPDAPDPGPLPDDALLAADLAADRNAALRHAYGQLPVRCQKLLGLLFAEPRPSYADVAAAVGAPIGSLGPSRDRCLQRLRELMKPYLDAEDIDLVPSLRAGVVPADPVPARAVDQAHDTFGERRHT
jgi:RNA polymerase sigma factor (sigma-70 family)